ncbi:hypothetical protein CDL15_Pgr006677 [Punica granatum]|uniref:QWRF motif-containing protein 2-like n=1 Tax=Punica granatum TaxID=22663 RepID=A0A218X6R8_PUNGR|nr:hypothetical protein CDL15_Pgr006677 [Punica granatum]
MVAAVSTTINPKATATRSNPTRPPLLPSDPDNALPPPRRPKSREVTSRYMSSTSSSSSSSTSSSSAASYSSKRCPSPVISRTASSASRMMPSPAASAVIKRSQSAERRRPATPRSNSVDLRGASGRAGSGEVNSAQKMLLTSARSLSVSFQGDSFPLQVNKAKSAISRSPSPSTLRRGTPERRKPASAATTPAPVEQHRWPARLRSPNALSRSVDITDERRKLGGSKTGSVVRALQSSMILDARSSLDTRLSSSKLNNAGSRKPAEVNGVNNAGTRLDATSDCLSSDSESGGGSINGSNALRGPRGIVVPARFMQEMNNRSRRQMEPGSPVSKNNVLKTMASTPKSTGPKKPGFDSPVSSPKGILNTRGQSPIRGAVRPASPSKLSSWAASSPRGMSPSRVRGAVGETLADNGNTIGSTPSISSFAVEVRKGKIGENRIFDAHAMRLLHNRLLQWRFVNARADSALSAQQVNAERSLYNAWVSITRLRESVQTKRFQLQLQRENMKLAAILKGQMVYLEEWASVERDYSSSLAGATEALMASTIRLPITGAKGDIQKMKNAISSAVDVMQAMASSICLLLSKVGNVNNSVTELANVVAKERALLDKCRDLLSAAAALQELVENIRLWKIFGLPDAETDLMVDR